MSKANYKKYKVNFSRIWGLLTPEEKDWLGGSGCGPANCKTLAAIVPELVFNAACKQHDACYYMGGTEEHREFADELFYENMCSAVRKESYWLRWFYYGMAKLYVITVSRGGKSSFSYRREPLDYWGLRDLLIKKMGEENKYD